VYRGDVHKNTFEGAMVYAASAELFGEFRAGLGNQVGVHEGR
jgi:hypothetical protein